MEIVKSRIAVIRLRVNLRETNVDLFVLLPRILGCWGFFARAFLLGRLDVLITMEAHGSESKSKFDFSTFDFFALFCIFALFAFCGSKKRSRCVKFEVAVGQF